MIGQITLDFDDIWDNIRHMNFESEAMKKATDKLEEALKEFVVAVQDAKVRKEEPVKEVKGPAIVTPEKEKPVQAEQK